MSLQSSTKKRAAMLQPDQIARMRSSNPMHRPEVKAKAAATRAARKATRKRE